MVASPSNQAATSLTLSLALALLLVALSPGTSWAQTDPATTMCLAAFDQTQALREAGKLLGAREQALACGREECPDAVKAKCKGWQREIDEATPSIVVRALDEQGQDTADAALSIDGAPRQQRLDGLPVQLDPGEHVVRLERAGQTREQRVMLTVGERARRIELSFAVAAPPPPAPAPARAARSIHPLTFVGFGLAGAGLVVGAITGGLALARAGELEDACPDRRCTTDLREDHDEALALAHTATVSLALAGAGAVLGVVGLFALSDFGGDESAALEPFVGLGALGLRGSF